MKISEIICEDFEDEFGGQSDESTADWDVEPGTSNATVSAVVSTLRDLIAQGHTDVDPTVITNAVVKATSKPFLLKDLIALNNQTDEVRKYIDSINPTKVKFSSDILTVKNEDPAKQSENNNIVSVAKKNAATVSNMAGRAASRGRQ